MTPMATRLYWNELSLRVPAAAGYGQDVGTHTPMPFPNRYLAQKALLDFINLVRRAYDYGAEDTLYAPEWDCVLAENYTLAKWRADSEVDRDTRSYFKKLQDKSRQLLNNTTTIAHYYEYQSNLPLDQRPARAEMPRSLTEAARDNSSIVVSLLSHTPTPAEWDREECQVTAQHVEMVITISVRHAARESHLLCHSHLLPKLSPAYVRDHRPAQDDETFLADRSKFTSTGIPFDGRIIYRDLLGNYYHVDNLHKGKDSHVECYGPSGNPTSTRYPNGEERSGPPKSHRNIKKAVSGL
jgi:hypothetical protein